jgi:hypothetical protein
MRKLTITGPCAAALVALAAAGLCACGSSGGGSAASAPPTKPAGHHSTAAPAPPANGALHGIVLASQPTAGTVELQALSPATGELGASRTFAGGSATLVFGSGGAGYQARQTFNSDFTEAAASGPQASDGSSNAGEVNAHGAYKPLTAGTSGGYGTTLTKAALGFDPEGNLWYYASDSGSFAAYGYVTPAGKDVLLKNHDWSANGMPDTLAQQAYFVPDGHGHYGPYPTLGASDSVFLPGGPEVRRDSVNDAYMVGKPLTLQVTGTDTPTTGVPPFGLPFMALPVDSHRFLAVGPNSADTQLYVGAVVGGKVHLRPLLPESNRTVGDMVVSPDGSQVAFVSTDAGGSSQIYTTSLSSKGNQPKLLWTFPAEARPATYSLVAWLN